MAHAAKPHIVIIGGGFAGLESAFYLRMRLQEQADITLISDRDYMVFRPNMIYIPFGLEPERLNIGLDQPTRRKNISFVVGRAYDIDPEINTVYVKTAAGKSALRYDFLMIATGAAMLPEEIPGLNQFAQTIWTPEEMLRLRGALHLLAAQTRARQSRRVLFMIPPNNRYSSPLYEMAFMLDTWLRRQGVRKQVEMTWTTYEKHFVEAFGPRLDEVTGKQFEERSIAHYADYVVSHVEKDHVVYRNDKVLPYDLLISFPPYIASTHFLSLPIDSRGFISTKPTTRQVSRYANIYAVGDTSDFPVKQAYLAFLQADAAAEHMSAQILDIEPAFDFEPVSMAILEQFDQATFAQVPLKVEGDTAVSIDSPLYKTGTSFAWRFGKSMFGIYLPWRFSAGEPFHAGKPWKGMETGLKMMSDTLAN